MKTLILIASLLIPTVSKAEEVKYAKEDVLRAYFAGKIQQQIETSGERYNNKTCVMLPKQEFKQIERILKISEVNLFAAKIGIPTFLLVKEFNMICIIK